MLISAAKNFVNAGTGIRKHLQAAFPAFFIFWSILVFSKFVQYHALGLGSLIDEIRRTHLGSFAPTAHGILYVLSHVIALLAFMYIVYLVGMKIQRLFKITNLAGLDFFVFSMAFGIGFLILFSFAIGMLGLYYRAVVYAFGIGVLLLSVREIKGHCKRLAEFMGTVAPRVSGLPQLVRINPTASLLIFLITFQCLVSFLFSLVPAIDWDSLNYHLNVPNRYAHSHVLAPIKFLIPSYMPHNIHLLYTVGILAGDFVLAKNINFAIGLLLVLQVYGMTTRFFKDKLTPLLAAYVLLFTPDILHALGLSHADLGYTFFYLISVDCVLKWHRDDEKKWLLLGGSFLGLALGSKYTVLMGVLPLLAALFLLVLSRRERSVEAPISCPSIFLAGMLAAMMPWLIRNFMVLRNPIYPLLYSFFGGLDFTNDLSLRWNAYFATKFGGTKTALDYVLLPWTMTVRGNFDYKNYGSIVPPLWLIAIPTLIFVNRVRKFILFMMGIFSLCFLFWIIQVHYTRYLFFTYPLLAIVTAYPIGELIFKNAEVYGKRLASLLRLLTVLLLVCSSVHFLVPYAVNVVSRYLPVVTGKETEEAFNRRVIANYDAFQYINKELPANAKVLFVWENRTYNCDRDIVGDHYFTISSVFELLLPPELTVEEIARNMQKYGITHLFYNENLRSWAYAQRGGPFFVNARQEKKFSEAERKLEEFKARYCHEVFSGDGVKTYRVDYDAL